MIGKKKCSVNFALLTSLRVLTISLSGRLIDWIKSTTDCQIQHKIGQQKLELNENKNIEDFTFNDEQKIFARRRRRLCRSRQRRHDHRRVDALLQRQRRNDTDVVIVDGRRWTPQRRLQRRGRAKLFFEKQWNPKSKWIRTTGLSKLI